MWRPCNRSTSAPPNVSRYSMRRMGNPTPPRVTMVLGDIPHFVFITEALKGRGRRKLRQWSRRPRVRWPFDINPTLGGHPASIMQPTTPTRKWPPYLIWHFACRCVLMKNYGSSFWPIESVDLTRQLAPHLPGSRRWALFYTDHWIEYNCMPSSRGWSSNYIWWGGLTLNQLQSPCFVRSDLAVGEP